MKLQDKRIAYLVEEGFIPDFCRELVKAIAEHQPQAAQQVAVVGS
jgi:hypothetical protein